jgi:nucleoside triphosphate pyrophosphatase
VIMPLWLDEQPLVLASGSAVRRMLLEAASIPVEVRPTSIDERLIEARANLSSAADVAALLAREKALAGSSTNAGRLVLGADQTLALGARRFSKPTDRDTAREQLSALRGRTHELHSAIAIVRNREILFEHIASARLTMRDFSDQFLDDYLDKIGPAATASVGGYQLEGAGVQLFDRIEGDNSTILGLPLLPLLAWLRRQGLLRT